RDLFYNTPARLKFLKSDYTEKIHIIRSVEEYAIGYKNIEFKFYSDGELIFSAAKTDKLIDRLKEVLKKDIVNKLIYFEYKDTLFNVYGFISPIELAQVNKSLQIFFVNQRPVTSRNISQMLYDAYRDSLPTGRHPIGIIFLEISPEMIDVNVHPTKRVVKFKDEEYIYETLKNVVRKELKKYLSSATEFVVNLQNEVQQKLNVENIIEDKNYDLLQERTDLSYKNSVIKVSLQKGENGLQEIKFPSLNEFKTFQENIKETLGFKNYTYLGQLHKTYLLLETQNGLVLIDQHAASERIMFEKFNKMNNISTQKLLFPINIELKLSDFEAIKPYVDLINQVGFELTISGKSSLGFYGIPSIININDVKDFISRFVENLISDIKEDPRQQVSLKEKIIRSACRAAIKANDILTLSDVENLISDLSMCEQPFSCPHGRPTILNLDISYIEKLFLRKK
ncbi:MAG: DNA mismatch repair endonuclease MutL, partial [Endomicrobiia bacterium]